MTTPAQVSIVIGAYNAASTIERCLQSLEPQVHQPDVRAEVIVVDSSTDATAQLVRERFPWVRLFVSKERRYPGDARNLGIAKASGDLLAFVDADCVVGQNWLNEILEAHQSSSQAAVGGSVDNANPESYIGWGYYFSEFTRWAPQIEAGPLTEIPTCGLSIKRWAFEQYGPFQEGVYCSDTDFNWKLDRAGRAPLFNPKIKVGHINPQNLMRTLRHEVEHGRAFGALRVSVERFSRGRQWLYVLGAPLLPGLLLARIAGRVFSKRIYIRQFCLAAPLVLLSQMAWSLGETLAYMASLSEPATLRARTLPLPEQE